MKPDFLAFVSDKYEMVVGGVKPPHNISSTNHGESDLVKLGRMMRTMLNDLILIGIKDPIVGGVLVEGFNLGPFIIKIQYKSVYELVELTRTPAFHNIKTLTLVPLLVADPLSLKVS